MEGRSRMNPVTFFIVGAIIVVLVVILIEVLNIK